MTKISIALFVYLVFVLIVTRSVLKDSGLTGAQKTLQVVLVWIIPVLGPCAVLGFQGLSHSREEMKTLVPSPFHLVGYTKPRGESYREDGEGVCG